MLSVGCQTDNGPIPPTNAHLTVTLRMAKKNGDYVVRVKNLSEIGVTKFVLKIQLGYLNVLSLGPAETGLQRGVPLEVSPSEPVQISPHTDAVFGATQWPGQPPGAGRSPHEQLFFHISWTYESAAGAHKGSEDVAALTLAPDEDRPY